MYIYICVCVCDYMCYKAIARALFLTHAGEDGALGCGAGVPGQP